MAAWVREVVTFENRDDYEFVSVTSVRGLVSVLVAPGHELHFGGPDADHLFENLLNRLRFEHASQVERRRNPQ